MTIAIVCAIVRFFLLQGGFADFLIAYLEIRTSYSTNFRGTAVTISIDGENFRVYSKDLAIEAGLSTNCLRDFENNDWKNIIKKYREEHTDAVVIQESMVSKKKDELMPTKIVNIGAYVQKKGSRYLGTSLVSGTVYSFAQKGVFALDTRTKTGEIIPNIYIDETLFREKDVTALRARLKDLLKQNRSGFISRWIEFTSLLTGNRETCLVYSLPLAQVAGFDVSQLKADVSAFKDAVKEYNKQKTIQKTTKDNEAPF